MDFRLLFPLRVLVSPTDGENSGLSQSEGSSKPIPPEPDHAPPQDIQPPENQDAMPHSTDPDTVMLARDVSEDSSLRDAMEVEVVSNSNVLSDVSQLTNSESGQVQPVEDSVAPPVVNATLSGSDSSSSASSDSLYVGKRFANYELLEEIARGGMGVVYKARQLGLNRLVAIKMILSGEFASETDVQRFRAEAEAAANLQHPNLVAIYEVGDYQGRHFFSMEYIEGSSLRDLLKKGPLDPRKSAEYMQEVAEAMEYVHRKDTLHRDLKPSNVLLDSFDRPRVMDFGLAKRLQSDSNLTTTGAVWGTPSYMAPEQARGRRDQIGPTADIYSMGAILYALLTGRPPFKGETPVDTIVQLLHEPPLPPSRVHADVPPALEAICLRCLAKAPQDRYPTAQALADDLKRYLDGQRVDAPLPVSLPKPAAVRPPLPPPPPLMSHSYMAPPDDPPIFPRAKHWMGMAAFICGILGIVLALAVGWIPCVGLMVVGLIGLFAVGLGMVGRPPGEEGLPYRRKASLGIYAGCAALALGSLMQCGGCMRGMRSMAEPVKSYVTGEADWRMVLTSWYAPPANASADQLFPAEVGTFHLSGLAERETPADININISAWHGRYEDLAAQGIDVYWYRVPESNKDSVWGELSAEIQVLSPSATSGLSSNGPNSSLSVNDHEYHRGTFQISGESGYCFWGDDWLILARTSDGADLDLFMRNLLRKTSVDPSATKAKTTEQGVKGE